MNNVIRRSLSQCLVFWLALTLFSPVAGAVVVGASQGLCTHVYLPDDSAATGIEVSLRINGGTTAAAHWGSRPPSVPTSRLVGEVPPADGAWHQLNVDLATGLSQPVPAGAEISDIVWVLHRNAGIVETWSDTCLAEASDIPPVITLLGNDPLFLEQGNPFSDPGSVCTDNVDGPCTATVDASALDVYTLGDYEVAYSATDSDGNTTRVVRVVTVVEEDTPPVITLLGADPVVLTVGSDYFEPELSFSCLDERYDGDCTAAVQVDLSQVNTNVLGLHRVVYSVTDSAGQRTEAIRGVIVRFERRLEAELATNPELHMQTITSPTSSNGQYMQWAPGEPWGLLIWNVNVEVASSYQLQFALACAASTPPCTTRTRDVIVNGTLVGQITHESTGGWAIFEEFELSVQLNAGNNTVQLSTPTNSTQVGPHVDYLDVVFDQDAEWRNVHPPVISLANPGPINLPRGATFTLPTYTCRDDVDGDCSAGVVVGGDTVDPNTGGTYVVTFSATDLAGNTAQVALTVNVEAFQMGSLTRSMWLGIGGKPVSSLTGNAAYPQSPTSVGAIPSFESAPAGDNYGQRIQGYLHPTTSGLYTFWIASDDASQLLLSTDSSPANARLIAEVPGSNYTNLREWTKYAQQTSAAIQLTAGQVYYIEALHKEGTGGEHVSVAWQGPGIAQQVIPKTAVSPLTYMNAPPTVVLKGSVNPNVLTGTAYTDPGFTCQDDLDGECSAAVVVGGSVNTNTPGTYVITYDVTDNDGNAAPRVSRTVTVGPAIQGSITREKWNGLNSGARVDSLTTHANYPGNPSVVDTITAFDSAPGGTTYGQRVHGYLHPTVTGQYTFWIASDDASQLWLNTTGTSQAGISKIAEVPGANLTGYQEWTKYSQQQSVTITLTAGQAYYIRALHKQAWSAQHLEVAWQGPGFSRQIIPGSVLSPMP